MTAKAILEARRPIDVFGDLPGSSPEEEVDALKRVFRHLSKTYHPDAFGSDDVFIQLRRLYEIALSAIGDGRYGAAIAPITFATSNGAYTVDAAISFSGHSSNYHHGTLSQGGTSIPCVVKMVRAPSDSRLLRAEEKSLRKIGHHTPSSSPFFPQLIDSFTVRGKGRGRYALAFRDVPKLYSLAAVRSAYPDGIDPRDMAWMFRRVLVALGTAHDAGVIHGAITPDHILIQPVQHGVVLIDWKHSVESGKRLTTIPKGSKDLYPKDVLGKEPVGPGLDIWMASKAMVSLTTWSHTPSALRAFFRGCTLPMKRNPTDAYVVLRDFDNLIEKLWGPRTFRPFTMQDH